MTFLGPLSFALFWKLSNPRTLQLLADQVLSLAFTSAEKPRHRAYPADAGAIFYRLKQSHLRPFFLATAVLN